MSDDVTSPYRTPAIVALDPCLRLYELPCDHGRRGYRLLTFGCSRAEHHDGACAPLIVSRRDISRAEFERRGGVGRFVTDVLKETAGAAT